MRFFSQKSKIYFLNSILFRGYCKLVLQKNVFFFKDALYGEAMNIDGWRQRLNNALEKSGRSKRSVSLAAGKGAGYLHSILSEGKEPTIESLARICHEINISMNSILYGEDASSEDKEFLALISNLSPEERQAILTLLKRTTDEAAG
ncbi:Uncharacterised protein [Bartonella doshiae]|uniref:Uncharacterized protein n=3 Tax=Bartonella doshiae TaxID=33044 RepID=A0A380ZGV2_BARDO|nr:hypothetical protein MCS_01260 [Bartonella doshiae NCTC 12862 = ATCC 700133]SUV45554.1 Uncharacterised protein [Bartonella doshiae]